MREKHNQPEVIQELLLKLMDDLRSLKGSQQEKKEATAQSLIPYWNSSMIDDEEARDNFLKDDKSSVENLDPIPSGSKGVSDDICDIDHSDAKSLLSQDILITSPKINFLSEEFAGEFVPIPPGMDEDEFDEEEDDCYNTISDDDSYENIEYVEASSLNLEYDSLEEENEDQEEKEFDLEDIFQIQDVILHEKLLNVHRLITNIESLKNNPTPDFVFKSPSSFPIPVVDSDSFFEESDTSLSHSADDPEEIVLSLNVEDVNSFTFVIWTFLPFFTYPEDSPVILSLRSEDLVFDPNIPTFHFSLKPVPFALPKDE
ncbi:hypothetical protein Tco_1032961 [Tanacetum coccineum]|uniref:Uncharacterized protein n=1 Tax=Tanacetum coccineum TaxID=301880 RepID=A0ABQ5GDW9_9ASTR